MSKEEAIERKLRKAKAEEIFRDVISDDLYVTTIEPRSCFVSLVIGIGIGFIIGLATIFLIFA